MFNKGSVFKGSFTSIEDEYSGEGKRPVVFDILSPDLETSILPDYLKLVLHVNPSSMKISCQNIIERIPTMGGFVEQHFGSGVNTIAIEASTGGFMRLYTGLISITGGGIDVGGTRRETLAYESYLDLLALFHNNGAVYDSNNNIILHGIIKISFDGDYWLGWFDNFSISEEAEKPYMFSLSLNFTVSKEHMGMKSIMVNYPGSSRPMESPFGNSVPTLPDATPEMEVDDPDIKSAILSGAVGGLSGFTPDDGEG